MVSTATNEPDEAHRDSQGAEPEGRLQLGSRLVSIAEEAGGLTDAEAARFDQLRDRTPAEPMRLE